MKPNILLISVDQMRGDCLSILNHPVVDTPNLDQLARSGVLFRNAYSATPSCIPARTAMLTGMSQRSHGRVGYQDKVPWDYKHTLPSVLVEAGYHTQCVGKMHVYPARNLCGFHNVVMHDGYLHHNRIRSANTVTESFDSCDDYLPWLRERAGANCDLLDLGLDCNASTVARPWHLQEALHPTNWVVTQSIDFLRRRDPQKPFFLSMSFVRPHPPFDPPQAFLDMYTCVDMPNPVVGEWAEAADPDRNGLNPITNRGIVPGNRLRRAQAAYYALITHIDHQIGRFLQSMLEYGVLHNTIILFTSDHGELLGDHHLFRKALPYEGSAKVPFILADPGGLLNLHKNILNDHVIEIRDIMPTLLDAAGASIPDTVDGLSLLPLARGESVQWRNDIHGEHECKDMSNHYMTDGIQKYIWFSQTGREQLFDLSQDPQETTNLVEDTRYKVSLDNWRGRLAAELADREEGYSDGKQLFVGCHAQTVLKRSLGDAPG
ncbi:arylsulfatase [Paenibacillus radicis (ex Xue et al. 2023)]|uniref:Arylsulfatase n=1 Tax=Paenibacillus radicis (ex Xue et al. 2023) TaxID=2972489 RepID=A0ABT1YMI9_9BACL|nr:arylsulfatase [Paenibacillus radicis (ex Xue et al. 2023)]MCR8634382.1 arylsulfatase [Paenibacillus radicis (ex Xue et al. 2023)]